MKFLIIPIAILAISQFCQGGPLRLQKRAAFYIANETACVVDETVYTSGDPIPTDDPCESCKCRPPGFACVLKECQVKPGCRAVRRAGHCCPEYVCGCEHNGRMYRDGDEIRDSKNPCYTCHCQGSSIACAFVDCFFRVDCSPEYVEGECCPRYPSCPSTPNVNSSFAADVTINPDINTAILSETTTQPDDESSKISTPPPLEAEISLAVDPVDISTAEEELAERKAGLEEEDKATIPTTEATTILEDPELEKAYVEESGETSNHQVSTVGVSESNMEIFAHDVVENVTREQATTVATPEVDEEANTIEKTFRALKNFTHPESVVHVETSESETSSESSESSDQSESSESSDESESSESTDQSDSSESKDDSESSDSTDDSESSDSTDDSESSDSTDDSESSDSTDQEHTSEDKVQKEASEDKEQYEASKKDPLLTAENREQSESTEKDQSHSAEPEVTVTSQDSATASQEIKTTEDADTASSVSDATTLRIEPTTKNPDSLYYSGNKLPTTESTVTAIVHVHDETSSQKSQEEKTTSVSKADQTTFAAKSETDPSTTPVSNSEDVSALTTSEKPLETTDIGTEKTEIPN